jgi:hypothetical protein
VAQPDDTKLLQVEAERSFSEAQLVPAAFHDLTVRRVAARQLWLSNNCARHRPSGGIVATVDHRHDWDRAAPPHRGCSICCETSVRNLGGAFGTALLATIVTKREQFHSDLINSSVTLLHDAARQRIDDLTACFMSHGMRHGVSDPGIIRKQAMIMGYSDIPSRCWAVYAARCGIDPGHAEGAGERRRRTLEPPGLRSGFGDTRSVSEL